MDNAAVYSNKLANQLKIILSSAVYYCMIEQHFASCYCVQYSYHGNHLPRVTRVY